MKTDEQFWAEFPQIAEDALKVWDAPSVGIGVIKDGKVVFCGGFGLRDVENERKADGNTLYMIGSCTKSFTAALCGIFVDKGLVDLDTPIRRYVPEVELMDPLANRECTLRDLLAHRTGLPRHEYSWYGTDFTREEMVEHMRYFEPSQPFRQTFQYCNYGYVLAGYILEKVSGRTWEELVQEYLFDPLGMNHSTCFTETIMEDENHAEPYEHDRNGGELTGMNRIPFYTSPAENREKGIGTPLGPAGCIGADAEDMLKYVQMFLDKGKAGDKQIISEAMTAELTKGQIMRNNPLDLPNPETEMMTYACGWFAEFFRGRKILHHGGNINGFSGFTSFMPDLNLGIVAYTNMNSCFVHYALARTVYDHYLGVEDGNWVNRYHDFLKASHAQLPAVLKSFTGERILYTAPSHPIEEYAGTYRRDGYTDMVILLEEGKLVMDFLGSRNALAHFHYDTFVTTGLVGELPEGVPVHFSASYVGSKIESLRMPLVTEPGGELVCFKKV